MASGITGCLLLVSYCVCTLAINSCPPHSLAQYKVTFEGLWTKERFPKVYPDLRPKAEWTSLIGRSHSSQYSLFTLGDLVNDNLQSFVEHGDSSRLDNEGQGHLQILDSFSSRPLHSGHGVMESHFFSDSERHEVSMAAKIVPSPDWFVGVDSYSLCQNGRWISGGQRNLFPLDAGSQQGYTFSSPRWQSDPQEAIHEITNTYPNRTADAFFYPHWNSLPPIARVSFSLLQVYQADETLKSSADLATMSPRHTQDKSDEWSSMSITEKPANPSPSASTKQPVTTFKPRVVPTSTPRSITVRKTTSLMKTMNLMFSAPFHHEEFTTSAEVTLNRKIQDILDKIKEKRQQSTVTPKMAESKQQTSIIDNFGKNTTQFESSTAPFGSSVHPVHPTSNTIDDEDTYEGSEGSGLDTRETVLYSEHSETSTERYQSNRILPPDSMYDEKACLVSDWTEWSECSRTCGYGTKSRSREIIRWTGNIACPELTMEQLCGSMKKCNWDHFSLKFNSSKSIFGKQKRIRQKKIKMEDRVANSTGALTGSSGSFRRRFKIQKL